MIILLVALAICIGVSYAVISTENEKNATSTAETEATLASFTILDIDPEQISRIYWKYSDWIDFDMSYIDGQWICTEDPTADLLEEVVTDTFLNDFRDVQAYKELSSDNLEDYGLADPYATAHIIQADGTETVLEFGNSTTISGYCYMRMNEEGPVYMVKRSFKVNFGKVMENFMTTASTAKKSN